MSFNFFIKIAFKSLLYRRASIVLSVVAIAISVFVLLSLGHVRDSAKKSFHGTISGIDLIVGPRTSDLNLLLTTVFRLSAPSQNMSWKSYLALKNNADIDWVLPIALGDSHRGFRVVGTEQAFFERYKYGAKRTMEFKQGKPFEQTFDVVLGAHVAQQLNYKVGQSVVISHGLAEVSFQHHDANPFNVVGVLKPTGTPIDNALYVSLEGLEAVHDNGRSVGQRANPASVTAAFVGLKSKFSTFKIQRQVNKTSGEALSAILPGVALTQLWQFTRGLENTLRLISSLVLVASLLGLSAVLLATVRERKTELRILRTLGAGPGTIFFLVQAEALGVAIAGIVIALVGFILTIMLASAWGMSQYGIDLAITQFSQENLFIFAYVIVGAFAVGALPAVNSYRELKDH